MLTILVIALLALPLLNFVVWFFLPRRHYAHCGYCATVLLGINVILSSFLLPQTWDNTEKLPFVWFKISESLGIYSYITLDRLSSGLVFLANFIGFLVQLYATFYLQGDRRYHRFFGLFGLFIAAMQLLVLTDNLLIIYVAWEVVGLCSYLLISFWYEKPAAVQAAQKAFLLNRAGDIGFLLGVGLLIKVTGSSSLLILQQTAPFMQEQFLFVAGLIGIFIACLAKSAQLPFSTWLPDAMQAPTPVSALLHAATMVVAGVYLLVRISPMFPPYLLQAVAVIGSLSALVAAVKASTETQPKRILAYSTISQLGLLFVAASTQHANVVFFHLCIHAFFKANLFLTVGILIKANTKPALAQFAYLAYLVSAASLAGLPFTSGFLSKEAILMAYLSAPTYQVAVLFAVVLTNCLTVYYILRQAYLLALLYRFEWKNFRATFNFAQFDTADKTYLFVFGLLAVLSLWLPFALSPFDTLHSIWVKESATHFVAVSHTALYLSAMAWCVGGGVAYWHIVLRKGKAPHWLYKLLTTNYLQLFYEWIWKNVFIKNSVRLKNSNNDFTNSVAWFDGQFSQWFDKYIIDKTIECLGIGIVVVGKLVAWLDKHTIDGGINGVAWLTGSLGNKSRTPQSGNIQAYIVGVLVWVLFLVLIGVGLLTNL